MDKDWPDPGAMFMRSFFKYTAQLSCKWEVSLFQRVLNPFFGESSWFWEVLFCFVSEFAEILTYLGESMLLEAIPSHDCWYRAW